MILTTTRHGRTKRDVRNLKAHLNASIGQDARVVSIGNVPLSNADDALRYMEMMRDGSRADVSMHHITISPMNRLTEAQRDEAVQRILAAMGAEDHAYVLWEHDGKARSAKAADHHFHFVVGHVGPDGKALDDAFSYQRLEAAARTMEVDFGEPITHSRRTGHVAGILREMGRDDVADMLVAPPDRPNSSTSSTRRAAAARDGIDLPKAQAAVRDAWTAADSPQAFRNALREQGFDVSPGQKVGVIIVTKDGVEIGALDRITREKRAVVAARMKGLDDVAAAPAPAVPQARAYVSDADIGQALAGGHDPARGPRSADDLGEAPAPVGAAPGGERGGRPTGRAERAPRGRAPQPAASPDASGGPAQEIRRPRRGAQAVAVHQLRQIAGDERLKALRADLRKDSHRRPGKAAEAVAVVGLAKIATDEKLTAARACLRHEMKPAFERVSEYLDGCERKAHAAIETSRQPVPGPAAIIEAQGRLDQAKKASNKAFYGTLREEGRAKTTLAMERPRGFLSWITGRTAAWQRDTAKATADLERIYALRAEKRSVEETLQTQLRTLERSHKPQMDAEQRRRDREGQDARKDLALVAAARACLTENPSLARQGEREVLRAARDRLQREQEERIRQEQQARRRASFEDRPTGPRFR